MVFRNKFLINVQSHVFYNIHFIDFIYLAWIDITRKITFILILPIDPFLKSRNIKILR